MTGALQFIFASFWHWAGMIMLILALGEALGYIIKSFRK